MSDAFPAELSPPRGDRAEPRTLAVGDAMSFETHAALSSVVVAGRPLGAVLHRVAELAVKTMPNVEDASVTLIERDRPTTVAFYGRLAVALDERQYESGFGPCIDAAAGEQTIHIDTADEAGAYPEFASQARREGVRYTLAIGLATVQRTKAALNLYASEGPFDQAARDAGASFAGYAAVTLFNAAVYAGAQEEVAQLKEAMASRAVIEQAKGMIMRERHCSADEAFTLLVKMSSRSNRKLRDLAQEIVEGAVSG
jgi:ANTAR domain-containing protein